VRDHDRTRSQQQQPPPPQILVACRIPDYAPVEADRRREPEFHDEWEARSRRDLGAISARSRRDLGAIRA